MQEEIGPGSGQDWFIDTRQRGLSTEVRSSLPSETQLSNSLSEYSAVHSENENRSSLVHLPECRNRDRNFSIADKPEITKGSHFPSEFPSSHRLLTLNERIALFMSTRNEDPPGRDLIVTSGIRLSSSIAKWSTAHTPDSLKFAASSNCSLQFANRSHRVSAHRSMRRKVACCQRHCSQEHDDGNDGDGIVGSDSVQQPDDNACQAQCKRQS